MTAPAQQFQRGFVQAVDFELGLVSAQLQSGPPISVPFIGAPPELYSNAWFCEVAPGALMCVGSPGNGAQCGIKLYQASTGSAASSTNTTLDWDSVEWFKNWWDSSSLGANARAGQFVFPGNHAGDLTFPITGNPFGLEVPFSGLYMVDAQMNYTANGTGVRGCILTKNGTGVKANFAPPQNAATNTGRVSCTWVGMCSKLDVIDALAYQTSGISLNTAAGVAGCFFTVVLLAAGSINSNNELMSPTATGLY